MAAMMRARLLRALVADGPLRLVVAGECMSPVLGDASTVELRAARAYWPGDVAVYVRADGRLVAHRVLGPRPGRPLRLFTRADCAASADAPVPASEVVGRLAVRVDVGDRLRAICAFIGLAGRRLAGRAVRALGT
jgi:hypothetical protein